MTVVLPMACDSSINKNIYVQDGERRNDSINTVNGKITVGSDCVIRGSCRTVNGSIRIGANSQVNDLKAVNGSIVLGENVRIRDDVQTVNGGVSAAAGTKIEGDVQNINGRIQLDHTTVGGDITTYTGDIHLFNNSIVKGDLIVKKSNTSNPLNRRIELRIEGGSTVEGDIVVSEKDIKVKVYIGKESKVIGEISGAEVMHEM